MYDWLMLHWIDKIESITFEEKKTEETWEQVFSHSRTNDQAL